MTKFRGKKSEGGQIQGRGKLVEPDKTSNRVCGLRDVKTFLDYLSEESNESL